MMDRKEIVNKDYTIVNDMECKGTRPALLPVIIDSRYKNTSKENRNIQPGGKMYNEIQEMKDSNNNIKDNETKEGVVDDIVDDAVDLVDDVYDPSRGIISPKYDIVYSYEYDLGQFRHTDNIMNTKDRDTPRNIKIRIHIPYVDDVNQIQCDINNNIIIFEYTTIYYLEINLLYAIDNSKSNAKYINHTHSLEISAPILYKIHTHTDNIDNTIDSSKNNTLDDNKNSDDIIEHTQGNIEKGSEDDSNKDNRIEDIDSNIYDNTINEGNIDDSTLNQYEIGIKEVEERDNNDAGDIIDSKVVDREVNNSRYMEVDYMMKVQSSYYNDIHIHMIHIDGYNNSDVDMIYDDSSIVLVYNNHIDISRYVYLHADDDSIDLHKYNISKKYMKDYLSINIQFDDHIDTNILKDRLRVVNDISYDDIRDVYDRMYQYRLSSEQNRVDVVDNSGSNYIVDDTPDNIPDTTFANDDNVQVVDNTEDNNDKDTVHIEENISYGYQLIDMNILSICCDID